MSGKRLQLKRGTTAQTSTFTGLNGEVTVDTTKKTLVVHDGSTIGGTVLAKDSALNSHTARTDNPHAVTKAQVGLANVDNTSDANKPVSTAQQTALNLKANLASPVFTGNVTGLGVATGTSFNSITGLSSVVGTTSGTAAVGTSTTVARADHIHPIQTTITGNSSTTTALQTARTLTIGSTGKTFDGTANVSWSVTEIGAQPVDADLTAISALAGTSGLLKKTAADTWTLDTSAYVTSSGVTSVTGTAPIVSSGGNTPAISINAATTSAAGSMSATDKTKLDGIATNANNYVKPVNEPISYITGLQTELDSKATTTALNTEKGRIDAILSASTASTDTFAEIVTLINSVDTTNDTTFAGYVSINDTRSTTIETNVTNLTNNKVDKISIQALHATDTLRVSGKTVSLYKGDGTFETIDTQDTVYVHPTSGAVAGTYSKVTVNVNGHITAGSIPTMEDIPDATFKRSVRCATTANLAATYLNNVLTMSAVGISVIDGITIALNDRVLIKDQTTTSQNGIYKVTTLGTASVATVLTRTTDADTASKIASALVAIDSGTAFGGKLFDNDFMTTDTLGTTAMQWAFNLDSGHLSSTTPLVAGTAAIGTGTAVARADHVHPVQTTITGNAGTATTLQTARTINGVSFNGSANIVVADNTKLPLSGGTLTGLLGIAVTGAQSANMSISADTNWWKYLRLKTTGEVIKWDIATKEDDLAGALQFRAGGASTTASLSTSGVFTASSFVGSLSGNASTATALQTSRNIGGVAFNGTSDITLPGVNATGNQATTGNADTATKLATINTTFSGEYPAAFDVNGLIYSHQGITYSGTTNTLKLANVAVTESVKLGSTQQASIQYNSTDNSIDFIIN